MRIIDGALAATSGWPRERMGSGDLRKEEIVKFAWNVVSSQIVMVVLVVLVGASGLAGCVSGTTRFNSRVNLAGASRIESLLVIDNLRSEAFGTLLYDGFQTGLKSALKACGVKSRMLQVDPMELDLSQRIEQTIKEFQPSAAMRIEPMGGSRTTSQSGPTRNKLVFEFKVFDLVSNKVTWQAKSMLEVNTGTMWLDDTASGVRFATSIASRLRDDGVLKGCPTDVVGWPNVDGDPECKEKRRSILAEALRTTVKAERTRLISMLPTCK